MKKYMRALYQSLFSKELYREVAQVWKGSGVLYLLLVAAIAAVPPSISSAIGFNGTYDLQLDPIIRQLPDISIVNGHVTLDKPQPYIITSADGKPVAAIDTTGKILPTDKTYHVLLTDNQLVFRKNDIETRIFDLSKTTKFIVSHDKVWFWGNLARKIFWFFAYPVILLVMWVTLVIMALIVGMIGIVIKKILKLDIGFAALLRLAAVSLTPSMLLDLLLNSVGKHGAPNTVSFLITLCFMFIACKSNVVVSQESQI